MNKRSILAWFDLLLNFFAFIAGILLLLVTILVSYTVVVRYIGLKPPVWVLQYVEYALLWTTFLGAGWLLREKGHIYIDTLTNRLPSGIRGVLDVIVNILGCVVCLVIVWFGTARTIDIINRGIVDVKGVSVPMYPIFVIIPVGGLLLLLQFIRNVFKPTGDLLKTEDK